MARATAHNVDFSNVKDGGNFNTKRIEEGDYLGKITKVEDSPVKSGDNKGQPQYLFTIKLVDHPSSVFPYYCQLTENQLWKLRNLLIAAGKSVPKRKAKVDPNSIVGKLIGVLVEDDEFEKDGKTRDISRITGVFPAADLGDQVANSSADDEDEDEDDEDTTDAPLEDDEADEAEDEADDEEEDTEASRIAGLNRAQLKAEIIKLQSDFQARKSQSDDDLRDVLTKLLAEADSDDEEEDDEPTPPPAKKKATATKKTSAAKKAKPKAEDIDDDELDELDIDSL